MSQRGPRERPTVANVSVPVKKNRYPSPTAQSDRQQVRWIGPPKAHDQVVGSCLELSKEASAEYRPATLWIRRVRSWKKPVDVAAQQIHVPNYIAPEVLHVRRWLIRTQSRAIQHGQVDLVAL